MLKTFTRTQPKFSSRTAPVFFALVSPVPQHVPSRGHARPVLVIPLALIQLDVRLGGVEGDVEPWVTRVLADSADYEACSAWVSSESWRTGCEKWVVKQLHIALGSTRQNDINAISTAFFEHAGMLGGGASFI